MRFFYFSLAEKLGMTVRQLLQYVDSRELTEWMAYYRVLAEPKEENVADKIKNAFAGYSKTKRK